MANYKTGVIVVGDSTGAVRSLKLTRAELEKLNKSKRKAATAAKSFSASIGKMSTLLKVAIPAVTVGTFAALAKNTFDAADKIGKLSARIGASTKALSEYRHVAELSGVQFNQLTIAWQRQTRRIAEAAVGTGEARGALKELGLEAANLAQLSPDAQFEAIAKAMEGVGTQADRVRLGMKLWDSEGVSMLQTMEGGVDTIREMRAEAVALGRSLSEDQVQAAEAANDAMTRMSAAVRGLTDQFVLELAPGIAHVVEKFNELWKQEGFLAAFAGGVNEAVKTMLHGVPPQLSAAEQEVVKLKETIRDMGPAIDSVNKVLAQLKDEGKEGTPAWQAYSNQLEAYQKIVSDAEKKIKKLTKETDKSTKVTKTNTVETEKNRKAKEKQKKALDQLILSIDKEAKATQEFMGNYEDLHEAVMSGNLDFEYAIELMDQMATGHEEMTGTIEDLIFSIDDAAKATHQFMTSYESLHQAVMDGNLDFEIAIDLVDQLAEGQEQAAKATERMSSEMTAAANAVDSAFVDLWESGFEGFENFREDLTAAFKKLLAQLAHQATTQQILVRMGVVQGGAQGGSSGVAYNSSTGGYNWDSGMVASVASGGTGEGFSMTENTMGAAGYGLAGSLGGMFGAQAFEGEHASTGASVGATIGMAWGPIGAIVGAVIGGFVGDKWSDHAEAVFYNASSGIGPADNSQVIGDPSRGNRFRPWEDDTFSVGAFGAIGLSNRGSKDIDATQFQEALDQITAIDNAIAEAFGPEATRRVKEALDGWSADGDGGESFNEAMADRLEVIIEALDFQWADLVTMGADSVEELTERLSHMKEIDDYLNSNALDSYTDLFARSQMTLRDQLNESVSTVARLSSEMSTLHGSTESMAALAAGLRERYELELQYLNQIRTVQEGLNSSIQSSIENIQLSVMTSEEQYDYFSDQAEALAATISSLSDPEQINETVNRINNLTNRAYGTLENDEQREQVSGEFVEFLEGVLDAANDRLDTARDQAVEESEQFRTRIEQGITDAMRASSYHFEAVAAEWMNASALINSAAHQFAQGTNVNVQYHWSPPDGYTGNQFEAGYY